MLTLGTSTRSDVVTAGDSAEASSIMLNVSYQRGPLSIPNFQLLDTALRLADKYELPGMKSQLRKKIIYSGLLSQLSQTPYMTVERPEVFASNHIQIYCNRRYSP
jgi:hypothetical protein